MTFQLKHPQGISLKSVSIGVSVSGDNPIVAAVAGRRIKVVAYSIQATGTVNVKWKDGGGADLSGAFNFQAREGNAFGVPAPSWMFGTQAGQSLLLNLDGSVAVNGFVTYFDDDAE